MNFISALLKKKSTYLFVLYLLLCSFFSLCLPAFAIDSFVCVCEKIAYIQKSVLKYRSVQKQKVVSG